MHRASKRKGGEQGADRFVDLKDEMRWGSVGVFALQGEDRGLWSGHYSASAAFH